MTPNYIDIAFILATAALIFTLGFLTRMLQCRLRRGTRRTLEGVKRDGARPHFLNRV
jgi:hypothetical protein